MMWTCLALKKAALDPNILNFFSGHYFYYYANHTLSVAEQVLMFPSHQYVCGLSFSYFAAGPVDLDVVRENLGVDTVFISSSGASNSHSWEHVSYQYNISIDDALLSGSALFFEVSEYDIGEAPLELDSTQLLLALDDVTLTFCLPCDYDSFVEPGAIFLGGPETIDIQLRMSTTYRFNASTPACPNETLVFTLEAGKGGGRGGGGGGGGATLSNIDVSLFQ